MLFCLLNWFHKVLKNPALLLPFLSFKPELPFTVIPVNPVNVDDEDPNSISVLPIVTGSYVSLLFSIEPEISFVIPLFLIF